MGDDLTVVVPPVAEEEPTIDEVGQELVDLLSACMNRIDNLVLQLGEQNARITVIEAGLAELGSREYALVGHEHSEYALVGHEHAEFAELFSLIEAGQQEPKEPDREPDKQHPWFRRIGS